MKLRNKKTGQLGNFIMNKDHFECVDLDYVPEYRNLTELNAEWEDYEEDKRYWYIDVDGEIMSKEMAWFNQAQGDIGNYFDTREEAEKAVEKLKAWKRLKDNGFEFRRCEIIDGRIDFMILPKGEYREKVYEDLDLLFGGEE